MNEQQNNITVNSWFLMAVLGFMFLGGLVTTVFFLRTNFMANKNIAANAETKRPANLELITITDKSCPDCYNLGPVMDYIAKENVKFISEKTLDKTSDEGKELIAAHAIKKLPAFILKGELEKNTVLAEFFSKTGDITDNTFVFRQVGAPYSLADTGEIKGKINFTMLTDSSCTTCYDVTQHELILQQFGILNPGTVVDAKSAAGQALIRKYKINLVPAFVLSGDMDEYPNLKPVWGQVGVVASDGAYVFTKGVPFMGTYKNLATNQIIIPAPASSTAR